MSIARFYLPNFPAQDSASLPAEEAAHAKVLRVKENDAIVIFDGLGNEAFCNVTDVGKRSVDFQVVRREHAPRCLPGKVVLAVSMPKGDRQRAVIEKAVELGVHELIPIHTVRSVAEVNERAIARVERIVVEACKQCSRNQLMKVHASMEFSDFLGLPSDSSNVVKWISHRLTDTSATTPALQTQASEFWLCVGPEGGFTDEELQLAANMSWRTLSVGDRILRVETAVSCAIAVVSFLLSPPSVTQPAN
jgi:16S rRNA (uracil1498-N3)-methyltransferase